MHLTPLFYENYMKFCLQSKLNRFVSIRINKKRIGQIAFFISLLIKAEVKSHITYESRYFIKLRPKDCTSDFYLSTLR